jgi:hypothetical protein
MIGNIKSVPYWRKAYRVEAIRLTLENMQQIADFLGGDYSDIPDGMSKANIQYLGGIGWDGDWILKVGENYEFIGHEDFMTGYHTHSEQLSTDEKYAKVFQIVVTALQIQANATFHGDTDGMDLVAIETTKRLLDEI